MRPLFGQTLAFGTAARDRGHRARACLRLFRFTQLEAADALANADIDALERAAVELERSDIRQAHAGFDPGEIDGRLHRIRCGCENVGADGRLFRIAQWRHLDAEPGRHLPGECFPRGRAVDLHPLDTADGMKRWSVSASHAARADHADDPGILAGQRPRADPHVLEHAVVYEGEQRAVAGREEHNKSAQEPGRTQYFLAVQFPSSSHGHLMRFIIQPMRPKATRIAPVAVPWNAPMNKTARINGRMMAWRTCEMRVNWFEKRKHAPAPRMLARATDQT